MQFNAAPEKFSNLGAQVIGVSTDSQESHQRFAGKLNLNILLLSDMEHTVLSAYDSWKPKTMFGKEFFGTQRDTFLIDPAGIIVEYSDKPRIISKMNRIIQTKYKNADNSPLFSGNITRFLQIFTKRTLDDTLFFQSPELVQVEAERSKHPFHMSSKDSRYMNMSVMKHILDDCVRSLTGR
jgi:hypothetical protein